MNFKIDKKDKGKLIFYTIMTMLWIIPIIITNNLYRDDYVREIQNTTIWEYAGRPFASLLYKVLSLSPFDIFNLYPLPTLLSGGFAIAGLFMLHKIFEPVILKNIFTKTAIYFVVGIVFFNPFVLQNWLYQYDVLSMIMALFFSIWAYYLSFSKKNFLISCLLLICALSMYQPGTPIFVFLVLINNIIDLRNTKNKLKDSLYYGAIYVVSTSLYYAIIKILPIHMVRGDILHSNSYIEHFKYNISQLVNMYHGLHINNVCIILAMTFITCASLFFVIKERVGVYNKIIGVLSIPSLFFFIWGPLSILEEPLEFPREFMATGILISFIFILLMKMRRKTLLSLLSIPVIAYFYIVLLMTEISQYSQNKFQNEKVNDMSYQLYQHENAYKSLMIFSYGQMRKNQELVNINTDIPFVGLLSKPDYRWQIRYRLALIGMNYTDSTYATLVTDSKPEFNRICIKKDPILEKLYSNNDYDIYFDKNKKYTVIWWKSTSDNICDNPVLDKDPE